MSTKNQELAAKLLAVGLGFKEWEIGEDIGGYKLALVNGMHGLVFYIVETSLTKRLDVDSYWIRDNLEQTWRYPYTGELIEMFGQKRRLGLASIYWTADSPAKNMYNVVDFRTKTILSPISYKKGSKAAATILVKEF